MLDVSMRSTASPEVSTEQQGPHRANELQRARILYQANQFNALDDLLDKLAAIPCSSATELAELAFLENLRGRLQSAEKHYRQALTLAPQQGGLHFNLATVLRYQGKLNEAEQQLELAISLNPLDAEAHLLLSQLRTQNPDHQHIPRLQQVLAQPNLTSLAKAQLHYALAKEQEDLGLHAQSFASLRVGAAHKRGNMRYQVQGDIDTLQQLQATFDADWLTNTADGYASHEPIFILGLPRTGSTLVERILSAHSEVHSAGELNNFALTMMAQCRSVYQKPPTNKQELVGMTAALDMHMLGRAYLQSTRPDTGKHAHFIDKLPLNSLNLGLIAKALPNARLIYVRRHPMDSCYAIYKQLFTQGYPFSYDLGELANYYIAHHQLMQHWQTVLGQRLYCLDYEALVHEPQTQIQALLSYCRLSWQDSCLAFHQQPEPSKTASATQIRQPLYRSSVGNWLHYQNELAELRQTLLKAGIAC